MRLQGDLKINNQFYPKGAEVPWYSIYPFFLLHMLIFGGSGFFMAYAAKPAPLGFLFAHGGFAILIYTIFYLNIFGRDEVKWMFINAGLGVLGLYSQVGWLLSLFHKNLADYPWHRDIVPFLYFVLYSFLVRHALLDLTGAREDEAKTTWVGYLYIAVSLTLSVITFFLGRR